MKKNVKYCAAALGLAAAGTLGGAWYAYNTAFRADPKRIADIREIPEEDWAYREVSVRNIDALVDTPFERVKIRSRDGLILRGKFYAGREDAPLLLFFHGYRSTAERDGSGGFSICREKGWKAMMADQRGHGESEGKTITFGVKERFDVLDWIDWAIRRFGEEQEIILVGISMGAATVLMAAGEGLPAQVKGIWADCGYSSPEAVLRHTIRRQRMPEGPAWFFTRLGGRIFGGFDVRESTATEAVKKIEVPVLIIHGQADATVPYEMAEELAKNCAAPVELVSVPDAHHGLSFYVNYPAYRAAVERLVED